MLSRSMFVVLAAMMFAACEKVPLLAPTGSTITVSAASRAVAPGASTEVSAFVVEASGTPVHNGTFVRFSATLGRVEPAEVETRGGIATATFVAGGASGTARITATSGGGTGGTGDTASNVVEILVGGAAASAVTVIATPSRVTASGGTVTIVASAVDASGNSLPGVPVSFTSTAGTLSANSATSDANGQARVSLTTNRESEVTARVGEKTATVRVTVGAVPSLTLATAPTTPFAGSPVTLTVTPAANTAPRVVVNWGDGRSDDLGVVAAARSVTHVYQSSGSYTIAASANEDGEQFSTSTIVNVGAAGVALSAPSPNPATAGQPVSLTVTPTTGTAPRVVINWGDGRSDDLGIVSSARGVVHVYESAGSYIITANATAGSETFTTSTAVTVNPRSPASVNVTADPSTPNRCTPVNFTATTPDGTAVSSARWEIDSNDNSEDATVTTSGNRLTRVFRTAGTKTISVTVTMTDGRTASGQTQIVVQPTGGSC
jgi:adhesin/invasin